MIVIPVCPECGSTATNIEIEELDVLEMVLDIKTVAAPPVIRLVPCMHRILGFVQDNATGNVTDLKPWPEVRR